MTELHDAALAAGVWAVIEDKAKAMKNQARERLAALPPGDTVGGQWDGHLLAKATMVRGKVSMVVSDPNALLAWVKQNHPTEITEAVNSAFMSVLEKRAKELGNPVGFDGELIPGLEMKQGEPYVSVRKEKDAEATALALFKSGQLSLEAAE